MCVSLKEKFSTLVKRMDDDDIARSCPHCRMDRVTVSQILECLVKSLQNVYRDVVVKRRPILSSLVHEDRVFYILGIVLLVMIIRLVC